MEILVANGTNGNGSAKVDVKTVIEYSFKLVSIILVPLLIWMVTLMISLDKELAVIKGNRFTISNGYELQQEIRDLESSLRAEMPPIEWKNRVIELERCQRLLELGRDCS